MLLNEYLNGQLAEVEFSQQTILLFSIFIHIGVWLMNNVVFVSDVWQSDLDTHTHESIFFFQILFPHRLLKNIEQTSLCYETVLCLQTALWSLDTHHSYVPESSQDFSVNHSTGASEWRAKLVSWSAQHCPRPRRKKIKLKKPVS